MTSTDRGPHGAPPPLHRRRDAQPGRRARGQPTSTSARCSRSASAWRSSSSSSAALMWAHVPRPRTQAAASDPQVSPLALPAGQQPPRAASADQRAGQPAQVPRGGDEEARRLRLGRRAGRRRPRADRGGQEADRPARTAGARERRRRGPRRHARAGVRRSVRRPDDSGAEGRPARRPPAATQGHAPAASGEEKDIP